MAIKVLVVDDSAVMRKLLGDVLSAEPELEVVGFASNGKLALERIAQLSPDVVTLDLEMPVMDGLATLTELRRGHGRIPVIVVSALTERGGAATLDALARGADDYIAKPSGALSFEVARQQLGFQLVAKVRALAHARGRTATTASASSQPAPPPPTSALHARLGGGAHGSGARPFSGASPELVAIGASTGGPNALADVLGALPRDFSVPVVIVQHMPPLFTRLLAERLTAKCPLQVTEAVDGDRLTAGRALVAPGDFHVVVRRDARGLFVQTHQGPPENSCRPAVDVLFRSVAEQSGARALAVVLTGMGQDGLRGCEQLREAGAQVLAQDEASSVVWGMPGFVARAGLAHAVLPLLSIGGELAARCRNAAGHTAGHRGGPT